MTETVFRGAFVTLDTYAAKKDGTRCYDMTTWGNIHYVSIQFTVEEAVAMAKAILEKEAISL